MSHGITRTLVLLGTLLLVRQAAAKDDPDCWVYFDSRETKSPAELVIRLAGGEERRFAAVADTVFISYLANRAWGRMPRLSLSLGDTNRPLLRFAPGKLDRIEKAELTLSMHLSKRAPSEPFRIEIREVTKPWIEASANWHDQPPLAKEPAARATLKPKEGVIRLDVTATARAWCRGEREPHGFLIKAAGVAPPTPRDAPPPRPMPGTATHGLLLRALAAMPFAPSVPDALKKARAEKKLVLAVATVANRGQPVSGHEKLLLATVLSHPDVVRLVSSRFVPVRVATSPWLFLPEGGGRGSPDPLRLLGTTLPEAKAPALVVSAGVGRHVATLPSLGTFDAGLVIAFLLSTLEVAGSGKAPEQGADALLAEGWLDAAEKAFTAMASPARELGLARLAARRGRHEESLRLAKEGRDRVQAGLALMRLGRFEDATATLRAALPKAGARAGEASYWLAALLERAGDEAEAKTILASLAGERPEDPFALKAQMRMTWPAMVSQCESLAASRLASSSPRSEVTVKRKAEPELIKGAVEDLLGRQRPDGSFAVASVTAEYCRPGVTALAAQALLLWRDDLDAKPKRRVAAALEKVDVWLDRNVGGADAETLNSFAAAYHVEYLLERFRRKEARKARVQSAVDKLVAGACDNGAWAYSRRFGQGWKGGFSGWPATDKGRTHSCNTGPALVALAAARKAGFRVDDAVIEKGVKALRAMRVRPGIYTYTWPEPRNFEKEDASIARGPVCDQALFDLGAAPRKELRAALDAFMAHRAGLRKSVKLTSGWIPPHLFSSYFYFFAYYHAACALAELGDATARRDLGKLRDDLLAVVEPDGTWVDYEATGKAYGTAMALLMLRRAGSTLPK